MLNEILAPIDKNYKYSKEIYSGSGELIAAFLSNDEKWRFKTELNEVSPYLLQTILFKEDKYFYYHFGFNPVSIIKSFYSNIKSGDINSGASTISMQVIRMLEKRNRTYSNKVIEIFRAIYLELKYSKTEILELYISLLPYGGNIEGVKSASYIYFDKPASKLSLSEAVILSLIPNNPNYLRIDNESNLSRLRAFRDAWLSKLAYGKIFTKKDISDAYSEEIVSHRYKIPNYIPHLSQYFKRNEEYKIETYINLKIQNNISEILKRHNQRLNYLNISNCAALVIDNQTGQLAAYCGSADFKDSMHLGQNDGLKALRSPGSTLKPALYALALDEGIITPKRILYDIPTDFDGYEPENFDQKFNGAVTAEFALYNSLNIPAVKLLKDAGLQKFTGLLKKSGFNSIAQKEKYLGLSMILGACGTNALELCRLFTAFSNKGIPKEIIFTRQDSLKFIPVNNKIFSEEAAYLINDMLKFKEERFECKALQMKNIFIPKISWKTGTSYGKRDAWCIGYDKNHTVVVWCGNFNGNGSPYLIGSETALPIVFEIFEKIGVTPISQELPKNISNTQVCKESGMPPNEYCQNTVIDYYIKNATLPEKCNVHKSRYISVDSAVFYCNSCLPKDNFIKQIYLDYPPEYKLWLSLNNKIHDNLVHNPECKSINYNKSLNIISPSINYTYYIERNTGQQICLQATDADINNTLYWYINNEYLGKSKVFEKIFFTPTQDNYLIKCVSGRGESKEFLCKIKFY